MGMNLFDDVDDEVEEISKIEVNEEFAKRYEHNKKREDLQKYEEMKKKGQINGSESESESDDSDIDDDAIANKKLFDVLLKIRHKDPVLKEPDVKLFDSSDEDDGNEGERIAKKRKPLHLKDVLGKAFREDPDNFKGFHEEEEEKEEEDDDEMNKKDENKVRSYVEEQEHLRSEVLAAMAAEEERGTGGESDEEGGLLREKESARDEDEDDDKEKDEADKVVNAYFGNGNELNENELYLKEFFEKELWNKKKNGKGKSMIDEDGDVIVGLSDDEEAIEKQEEYEREFNFRFEEGKSDRVLGYARVVEGSVRKETNTRKQQRERKKERLEMAELERQEEVKRLKNLKRKEIQEKIDKIKEIAGVDGDDIELDEEDLEGDFDPEEFDKKMNKAFGEKYYEAEDVDPEFGSESEGEGDLEKPDFDEEDELLGLPKDWDVIKSNEGFLARREQRKKSKLEGDYVGDEVQGDEEDGNDVVEDDGDEQGVEGKRKRKRKSKLKEALKKELEEELYKLDYEDAIGDLKTRFKYRPVKPNRYKLSAAEILWLDEQELNQYVSLKKLAPYRDQEWKVPLPMKQRLLGGLLNGQKIHKKKRLDVASESTSKTSFNEDSKSQEQQLNAEDSKLSRSARRRKNQKEKKLPASRLLAYGKMASSSKKKSKS